jgi:competence protein ComEC
MNNPRNLFYYFIIGFCAGIFIVDAQTISFSALVSILITSLVILGFLFAYSRVKQKHTCQPLIFVCVFACALALGGIRMDLLVSNNNLLPLSKYESTTVTLVGRVVDRQGANGLLVDIHYVIQDNQSIAVDTERVILSNIVGVFDYGDMLAVSGRLDLPKNIKSEDGKNFDYVSYLKTKSVSHVVAFPKVLEQKQNDDVTLRSILYNIKKWFEANIQSVVPEPESSLATGVTIAGKGALPKDVQDDFVKAGIIHVVVLSGYNISIIIKAMMGMFGFVGRRSRILIAGFGILLFVIMAGATAPVVRSAIMATITLLGTLSYKTVSQNRVLLGAGFIMVLLNPYILGHDASFILSVLSTFAIINGVDFIKKYLGFVTEKGDTRQVLSETLVTQIFVLPYILYQIGRLSVIAPLSNIIVLPFIPWIMLGTFIVGMIAFIPFVALPFAGIVTIISGGVIWLAHIFANIPFASFEIKYFPLWAMIGCYIVYFALWYMLEYKKVKYMNKVEIVDYDNPY